MHEEREAWEADPDAWKGGADETEMALEDFDVFGELWPEQLAGPEYWMYKRLDETQA